jgi:DNA-binding response OmpR family regulator
MPVAFPAHWLVPFLHYRVQLITITFALEANMPGALADKVLVVEDDPGIRELVRLALHEAGFRVEEARDGGEAIRAIDGHRLPPDRLCLVLLDLMLPKVDGLAVLNHLAAQGAKVPVVAMSASREKLQAAAEAGAQEILPKPFDLDKLLEVVGRRCPH